MPSANLNRFIWLFLSIFWLSTSASAKNASDNDDANAAQYRAVTQPCDSCHVQSRVDTFKANIANNCQECHSSGDGAHAVWVEDKKFSDPDVNKPAVATPPEATQGMSVPMYYNETRIGKEPNSMVLIPAGNFIRGSTDRLPDEGPQYTAETKAFWIDKYEVTNLQYKQFIDATKRKSPTHFRSRTYPEGKVDHPVVYVTWHDAHDYCDWAGKRLPTDIEWEKAARGTDDRDFPWGNEFDVSRVNSPVRWKSLEMEGDTTPAGAFEGGKSPYGLYDMSGNVWEWTASWYTQYPGNTWASENYGEMYKVLKGGSWWDCSYYQCGVSAPVFNRSYFKQNIKNSSFGFRCAKDAKENI